MFTSFLKIIGDLIIFGTQTSGLNTSVSEENRYFLDFFMVRPNFEHYKEDSTRFAIVDEIAVT